MPGLCSARGVARRLTSSGEESETVGNSNSRNGQSVTFAERQTYFQFNWNHWGGITGGGSLGGGT